VISILIPVLARPQNAKPVVDSIRAHTTVEHEIIFICSRGDVAQINACYDTAASIVVTTWEAGPGDAAKKWNLGFAHSKGEVVFCAADDVEFTPGWDTEALRVAESTGASVIGTNDDANPLVKRGKHSTHTMVRRSYVEEHGLTWDNIPGLIYCEEYDHQSIDQELVYLARERGIWAFARNSVVKHNHPIYDKTVRRDSTYDKALARGHEDLMLFRERLRTLSPTSERRTRRSA